MSTLEELEHIRVVPVIVIDDESAAVDLARALAAGGIGCAEIALRTDGAVAAISSISAAMPGFLVGAGTVLTVDDVDRAVDAGAAFVVSPGLDEAVVSRARERGITPLPGVATATEVQRAAREGLGHVKFFPAEPLGGVAAIAALAGPFPAMRFLPSGGVTAENAGAYLESAAVFAVSGSWMAPRDLIAARDWDEITRRSAATIEILGGRG